MQEAKLLKHSKGFVCFFLILLQQYYDQVSISAQKKESGELSILFNDFELPLKYAQWMDIYAYHLEHPGLNYIQLSNDKKCGTATISRALSFMNQQVRWRSRFLERIYQIFSVPLHSLLKKKADKRKEAKENYKEKSCPVPYT